MKLKGKKEKKRKQVEGNEEREKKEEVREKENGHIDQESTWPCQVRRMRGPGGRSPKLCRGGTNQRVDRRKVKKGVSRNGKRDERTRDESGKKR